MASDRSPGDRFGFSVSIEGGIGVVGAPNDDDGRGAAYVFRFDGGTWVQEQKLTPAEGAQGDRFGHSVAVSGTVVVIGADFDDDQGNASGTAFVFRFDGTDWEQEQKLLAADGLGGDLFGHSVSVDGDLAVVGAPGRSESGLDSGSAYVFRFDGAEWEQEQILTAPDGTYNDHLGASVSVQGDIVLAGAPGDGVLDPDLGYVYVYRHSGDAWVTEKKLIPDDGSAEDRFGDSVSIHGDLAVVGVPGDDDAGHNSGSAWVYRLVGTEWAAEAKLSAPGGAAGDNFGSGVSVRGDIILVGAPGYSDLGAAYLYRRDGSAWVVEQTLLASAGSAGDLFGSTVSLAGETALVGAWGRGWVVAYVYDAVSIAVQNSSTIPRSYALGQNYPNPFSSATTLTIDLPDNSRARLAVYDVLGRVVRMLIDNELPAGSHLIHFDAGGLPGGVYVAVLDSPVGAFTRCLVLMK